MRGNFFKRVVVIEFGNLSGRVRAVKREFRGRQLVRVVCGDGDALRDVRGFGGERGACRTGLWSEKREAQGDVDSTVLQENSQVAHHREGCWRIE